MTHRPPLPIQWWSKLALLLLIPGCSDGMRQEPTNTRAGPASVRQDLVDLSTCGPGNLALNPSQSGNPSPLGSELGAGGTGWAPSYLWEMVDGETEYPDEEHGSQSDILPSSQVSIDFGRPVTFDGLTLWHHSDNGVPGHNIPSGVSLEYFDGSGWQALTGFSRSYDLGYPQPGTGFGSYPDQYGFPPVSGTRLRWSFDADSGTVPLDTPRILAAGNEHSCAIRATGAVACWGRGELGRLGVWGSIADSRTPVLVSNLADAVRLAAGQAHTCALRASEEVVCWGAGGSGQLGTGALPLYSTSPQAVSGLNDVIDLAAGGVHACALHQAGTVACWGGGGSGQLGNGSSVNAPAPVAVSGLSDAVSIAAGYEHSCAVRGTGEVVCWGDGARGQLGTGGTASSTTPVPVVGLTDAVSIEAGAYHTCARRRTGEVSCWGANESGQLGDGTAVDSAAPVPVSGLGDARGLTGGYDHTCAVRANGRVACWGQVLGGEAPVLPVLEPVQIPGLSGAVAVAGGLSHACSALASGELLCWGTNDWGELGNAGSEGSETPVTVFGFSGTHRGRAVAITSGSFHACVLTGTGEVFCWAEYGFYGELGNGTTTSSAIPARVTGLGDAINIDAGRQHTCAVRDGGTVVCWGRGDRGQLGDGAGGTATRPVGVVGLTDAVDVASGSTHSCAVRETGEVVCWGSAEELGTGATEDALVPVSVPGIGDAAAVAAGLDQTCALRTTGQVSCWGGSGGPTLVAGLSDAVSIAQGERHACTLRASGEIACWGRNNRGQLGDGTTTDASIPVPVVGVGDAVSLALGDEHSCAVRSTGELVCWGSNFGGQLGNGTGTDSPTPVTVSALAGAAGASAGYAHTCAVRSNGTVSCWGSAVEAETPGPLGVGIQSATPISASNLSGVTYLGAQSSRQICAVTDTAEIACWGRGPLGDGSTESSGTPVTAAGFIVGITGAVRVASGGAHTCALRGTGEVACWGYGGDGQLGNGANGDSTTWVPVSGIPGQSLTTPHEDYAVDLATGYRHSCAVRASGKVACWGANVVGQLGDGTVSPSSTPVEVLGLDDAVMVAAGGSSTCALREGGEVACWGSNSSGELGNGTTSASSTPVDVSPLADAVAIAVGTSRACAVRSAGEVVCWGWGAEGGLGNGTADDSTAPVPVLGIDDAIGVSAGWRHVCAVRETGEVACWGYGAWGQLGNNALSGSTVPVTAWDVHDAVRVTAGDRHTCVQRATGEVACWGRGNEGELGNGVQASSTTPVSVSGFGDEDSDWRAWIYEVEVNGCVEPGVTEDASDVLSPGESLTTDTEGDGATPTDPVETTVTTPIGGPVEIHEGPVTTPTPSGFIFFGVQIDITAPSGSITSPLTLEFAIDETLLPAGVDETNLEVFRNGVLVPACVAPPSAIPNPCVASRARVGDDVVITVLTTSASAWNFGVALDSDRDGDGTLDGYDECPDDPLDRCNEPEPSDGDGDGVLDEQDRCPDTQAGSIVDRHGCSVEDRCPCQGPRGPRARWKNHGEYIGCVAGAAQALRRAHRIGPRDERRMVREAARSSCGWRPRRHGKPPPRRR